MRGTIMRVRKESLQLVYEIGWQWYIISVSRMDFQAAIDLV